MDCGYNCHEKCIESVPKNCTRFKSVRESGVSIQTSTKPTSLDTTSVGSGEIHILTYVVTHRYPSVMIIIMTIQVILRLI